MGESGVTPPFSESMKDIVLERLLGLIGTTNRYFVEIGTQAGVQCNTRYLRVRYGFKGLMIDDTFRNEEMNQQRHFVKPGNIVELFEKYNVPLDFDLVSFDTDGN